MLFLLGKKCACANFYTFRMSDQRMHSHNDCICLAFLHCEFSYVSSNYLREMMQSCIGLAFQNFQEGDPSPTRNKVGKENLRQLDLSTTAGSWILTQV